MEGGKERRRIGIENKKKGRRIKTERREMRKESERRGIGKEREKAVWENREGEKRNRSE